MSEIDIEELPFAVRYTPPSYWGCPNCGADCWGAINPTEPGEMIYRCNGATVTGNPFSDAGGCGKLFRLPREAHDRLGDEESETSE